MGSFAAFSDEPVRAHEESPNRGDRPSGQTAETQLKASVKLMRLEFSGKDKPVPAH